jgi:hypothetical protein
MYGIITMGPKFAPQEVSAHMRRLGNPMSRRQQELGWSDKHAAYRVRIALERYLMIVNGNGNPEPDEIEKIVAEMALARNELLSWVRRTHGPIAT